MANETEFVCDACGISILHDPTERHIPIGWCNRKIEGTVYLLCSSCGLEGPHAPDISLLLCENFSKQGIFIEGCKKWGVEPKR